MEQIKRTRSTTWLWNAVWIVGLLLVRLATAKAGPVANAAWPPIVPSPLTLTVRETAGVTRVAEVARSGVPLPRSLNILTTTLLTIVDASNQSVPAEFEILARWNAGRADGTAPIQWLLVTFPVTVTANSSATYRLITDGSAGTNPAPSVSVGLIQNGNRITVTTGAATFVLGGSAGALFDEIRLADGTRLVTGSTLTATIGITNANHSSLRRVRVEHAGPLAAIVVVDGAYDLPAIGDGGLGSFRRYIFTAGSPTAIVRQAVNWEGDLCPGNGWDLTCNGNVNGLRVTRVRDALTLNLTAPVSVTAVGAFGSASVQGSASAGQSAWVRQQLRANRTAPLAFDVNIPGAGSSSGQKADGGVLAVSSTSGAVVIAFDRMHRYEPQALRLLPDGRLAIDLADDRVWLGQRQGLFATFAVSALPTNPVRAEIDRLVWSRLDHPLHAWPSAEWFASSEAVDEFPAGSLSADVSAFDSIVPAVLTQTVQQVESKGLGGLMTFGLYPRYWGYYLYADELDCGDDPTPAEAWDNTYWCATWTDYHNTVAAVPMWVMRSGETQWLDEIAFPGALRMLHTQINQCAPADPWFYCGQAPAGYGGYREDFNSSHAYFDNLFLYYWLTGDYSVVDILQRGASSMRDYLCPSRPCPPGVPPTDEWAQLTGRVASQWFAAFRFVGLASNDASYLDDYKSGLARAVTQYYVEAEQNSTRYGFWLDCPIDPLAPCPDVPSSPASTSQLWMVSLYDMNNLYRLQHDTNDAPIGNPAIPPSQVIAAWARTLTRFGSTVSGDGTASGNWPNALYFTWSGNRIGGTLTSVTANTSGDDPFLYTTGKAALTAEMMRAADQTGDATLRQMAIDLTALTLVAAQNDSTPLSKLQGEYLERLPAAVARIALASAALPYKLYLPLIAK
jgi:hypothetical protein